MRSCRACRTSARRAGGATAGLLRGDHDRRPSGGLPGVTAFAEFAARLDQEQLAAAGAFFSPSRGRRTAPAASTFHYILSSLPPDALDRALGAWTRQRSDGAAPVALDGKDVRGASKQTDGARRMMVAAVEHGTGLVLG